MFLYPHFCFTLGLTQNQRVDFLLDSFQKDGELVADAGVVAGRNLMDASLVIHV
jgi:hypothetical protein